MTNNPLWFLGNVIQEDTKEKASEKKDAEKEIKKIMILIAHDTIMILGMKNIGFRKGLIYQPDYL